MTDHLQSEPTLDDRLDAALAEYYHRVDQGLPCDRAQFLAEYPGLASELREYFDVADEIERMAGPMLSDVVGSALQGSETSPFPSSPPTSQTTCVDRSQPTGPDAASPTDTASEFRLPEVFGRYCILRRLGQGGMGTVFLAKDTQLQREVALKVPHLGNPPDPELAARFLREARVTAALSHPNICPLYDLGEIDGIRYATMKLIDGRSLADAEVQAAYRRPAALVPLLDKIAAALAAAHAQGIVHRDLKPSNIMLTRDGEPIVMDFGLARQFQLTQETQLTLSHRIIGSPAYMAPEQIDSDLGTIGPQTDIYSLGVVCYELLTGRRPFTGSLAGILSAIVSAQPRPPIEINPQVDPSLAAVCLKMLSKRPQDRYASMLEVRDALAQQPASVGASSPGGFRGPRLATASLLGAGLLLAGWSWGTGRLQKNGTDDAPAVSGAQQQQDSTTNRAAAMATVVDESVTAKAAEIVATDIGTTNPQSASATTALPASNMDLPQAIEPPDLHAEPWRLLHMMLWRGQPEHRTPDPKNPSVATGINDRQNMFLQLDRHRGNHMMGFHRDSIIPTNYALETRFKCTHGAVNVELHGRGRYGQRPFGTRPRLTLYPTGQVQVRWNNELLFDASTPAETHYQPGEWNVLRVIVDDNRLWVACNDHWLGWFPIPAPTAEEVDDFASQRLEWLAGIGLSTNTDAHTAVLEWQWIKLYTSDPGDVTSENKSATR